MNKFASLIYAILRLLIILPFSPFIVFVLLLTTFGWNDFKDELTDILWAYDA